MTATHRSAETVAASRVAERLRPHAVAVIPGAIAVGLMILWAVQNGGYDPGTWYWGALLLLATCAVVASGLRRERLALSRASTCALVLLALYVAWSYLSIAWAGSPGDALEGSNRALLYLLIFALMASLPWTAEGALLALTVFALGVGTIAVVILLRLASADHVPQLVEGGRLAAPTGYFNATVALFMIAALVSIVLASRRELPGLLRGLLIAVASADLQLVVIGQSRGWLFTLPIVLILSIVVVRDRLRVVAAAVLPVVAAAAPVHRLIDVFNSDTPAALNHAARDAGEISLVLCAAMLVVGTLIAWGDGLLRPRPLTVRARRMIGGALVAVAIAGGAGAAVAATHGDPFGFVKRQWDGFSHPARYSTGSHFSTVGSGRYDFWRVSLDAVASHPLGGLGQDNFADYYITRRRTNEEPAWTHSLEMRLLAHTGIVGLLLFAAFLVTALIAALGPRRRGAPLVAAAAGTALLPLVVWVVHGSVDWFWEMPALSGPALGFLGMAAALGRWAPRAERDRRVSPRLPVGRIPRLAPPLLGGLALIAGVVVLGFPYLSLREMSAANSVRAKNPAAALNDLTDAARLNPLSPDPGRLGGVIALQTRDPAQAQRRFAQAISREPGGWFAWFGAGLAASALGNAQQARHDFEVAARIEKQQPVVREALARVDSTRPLTPGAALALLAVAE